MQDRQVKPRITTIQHVENKVRYFLSALEVDRQILPFIFELLVKPPRGNGDSHEFFEKEQIFYFGNSLFHLSSRGWYLSSQDGEMIRREATDETLEFKKKLEKEADLML
jgi:hypothetical protein